MLHKIITTLAALAIAAASAAAQETALQKPAAEAKTEAPARRTPGQLANISVELTITDQRAGAGQATKTVSMLVADGETGRVRTSSPGNRAHLNVDAQPQIVRNGKVLVNLTLLYAAEVTEGEARNTLPSITTNIGVILDDGKPLVISRSADPGTDRTVAVEAKAAILK